MSATDLCSVNVLSDNNIIGEFVVALAKPSIVGAHASKESAAICLSAFAALQTLGIDGECLSLLEHLSLHWNHIHIDDLEV